MNLKIPALPSQFPSIPIKRTLILLVSTLVLACASLLRAQGEIGPHFPKAKFTYMGEVHGNSTYIKLADPKSKDLYHLATIGGLRAVQIFTSMKKDGQVISVWGLMFVKEGKIIALQGLYKNDDGKALLTQVMTTFQFTDK